MASIRELQQQKKLLEEQKATKQEIKAIEDQIAAQEKRNAENAKKRAQAEKDRATFKKEILKSDKESRSLEKDVLKLLDSQKGQLLERLGVLDKENQLNLKRVKQEALLSLRQKKGTKAQQKARLDTVKALNATGDLQKDILADFEAGTLEAMSEEEIRSKILEKAGLSQKEYSKITAEGQDRIDEQVKKLKNSVETLTEDGMKEMYEVVTDIEDQFTPLIKKAKTFGGILANSDLRAAALKGGIAAIAFSFAKGLLDNARELRQELGGSVGETLKLATQVSAAETKLKFLGGNAGEVKNFAVAISEEFGNINELSLQTADKFALISASTGLTGQSAAKLAKSIQTIQGGTLDTSLNTIETFKNLSRAAGVSSKLVLEDIANDTESFAKFAKDGGKNIGIAAIAARRLGLNLGTVAGIAENLLDFESSIEKQLEASVLLGRQLNLDKARELALTGDLAGVAEEVKNQVGSQADFEAMNVVQRKALADSIGISVADLGKMIAGEATSAELAEKRAEEEQKRLETQMDLTKVMATAQAITAGIAALQLAINAGKSIEVGLSKAAAMQERKGAVGSIAKAASSAAASAAKVPFIGPALAIAALAAVGLAGYKLLSKAPPAMETGGMVTKSGIAEVHKGEAFSGTKNQMGFGTDMKETNSLLQKVIEESRQLRTENAQLMNTLTSKVGEMAMSS